MKPPCDDGVIESGPVGVPCLKGAGPWVLAATILGSSMAFIDSTVVNVALPALQTSLGGTVTDIQWVVQAYGLLLGALILVGGSLGDLFGRRRMFLVGADCFRSCLRWLRSGPEYPSIGVNEGLAGAWGRIPRTWQLVNHQFLVW